jgi:Spy/CpxP family protein refolding chaperone
MLRLASGLIVAIMMTALAATVSAENQPPKGEGPPKKEGKGDKKGPPMGKEGGEKKGPPMGKGFELGKVLPPFAFDELDLTEEQRKQIADLEKEVKAKLEKILTAAQKKKLQELSPKGPKGPMGGKGPDGPGGKGERPSAERPGAERPGEVAPMPRPNREQAMAEGIQWFAILEDAKAEARRLNKPILLTNGTPHCAGIPGIW